MTFVVSGDNKGYLREFTKLLFSAFSGITVYEHGDLDEAAKCVNSHRISAVFIDGKWDAANGYSMLRRLRERDAHLPVYLFADSDQYEEDALWYGATGYLNRLLGGEALKTSIRVELTSA